MNNIGWNRHFASEQVGNDEDLLQELLVVFTRMVAMNRREIEKALTEDNWPQVTRVAHSIKGAASSLGFGQIADMANTIEGQARDIGATTEVMQFLAQLKVLEDKLPNLN